ncbi:MAG: methyltransferase [Acidobacteriota bacterium]|nr:methyltransferase [Acidobacteriota bacterium]
MFPLKIGSSEQFQTLRQFLFESGYTEQAVCRRLKIPSIYDFKTLREGRAGDRAIKDTLDALIRLLMDEEPVESSALAPHLTPGALRVMAELGIVKPVSKDSDSTNQAQLQAEAVLYPQEGLFIASDHAFRAAEGPDASLPDDVVYASITKNTGRFISILPSEPCETFLELCAGTGIAALIAGVRYAKKAWAADLSDRCTHFAEFNKLLNGIENVTAVQSDLYAAVEGLRFDRIAAHPPYIPASEQKLMFRDGGEDGEQILRGVVQGLPRFLNPGGLFYALTLATDRENETFEQRIRRWLGEAQDEFDLFLVLNSSDKRPDSILKAVAEAKGKLGDLGPRTKLYDQLKVKTVLYGVVVLERRERAGNPITGRCLKAENAGSETVEWFRNWQISTAREGFDRELLAARPHPPSGFRLIVSHAWQDGELLPREFRLRCEYPLSNDARAEPWVAVLVGACNGSQTVAEIYQQLKAQDVIAAEMSESEFCKMIKVLVGGGFLEVPEYPLPVAERKQEAATAAAVN